MYLHYIRSTALLWSQWTLKGRSWLPAHLPTQIRDILGPVAKESFIKEKGRAWFCTRNKRMSSAGTKFCCKALVLHRLNLILLHT